MSDPLPCKIVAEHPDWIPRYQTPGAACADLRAWLPDGPLSLDSDQIVAVDCGFSMALPPDWKAEIAVRSGLASRGLIVVDREPVVVPNDPGQVDEDYRGRVKVLLMNLGLFVRTIEHGDRVAQMWPSPVHRFAWQSVAELDATGRGAGGFGSTGAGGKGADEPERADEIRPVWRRGVFHSFAPFPGCRHAGNVRVPAGWFVAVNDTGTVSYRNAFGALVTGSKALKEWGVPGA